MERKPVIVITMGDPAGIGPEIIAKIIDSSEIFSLCKPVVIGDAGVMKKQIEEMRLPVSVKCITSLSQADPANGRLDVLDLKNVDLSTHRWGSPGAASGTAVVEYIKKAVELTMNREADAIVTAPISKEMMNAAGHHYAGHTELISELTGTSEYGMMFVGGGLRVILATIHVALKEVPRLITQASVLQTLRLAHKAVQMFGIDRPRIGVAALNPHAGEGRLFGNEEWDSILPAVIEARGEGIHASDPIPADTLFYKARNNYFDIVVAMYHDQGLAPLKMIAFGKSVNITVGLPIIRTSVDHGTAYDIAGKGCADPASLHEAVTLAVSLSVHRTRTPKEML
jgi:4-hydroxythreonine-4-phosphate dehydrogenase